MVLHLKAELGRFGMAEQGGTCEVIKTKHSGDVSSIGMWVIP